MNTKLSIITINYNNAKGLRQTMSSVLEQSFADYEYIVIDGGSSDGSVQIIEEFENQFKSSNAGSDLNHRLSFQWISESDNGIYNAMNKGIALAKGDYCFFLNSGDYLVSKTVLESVFSENPTEDIIFGNLLVCRNGENRRYN